MSARARLQAIAVEAEQAIATAKRTLREAEQRARGFDQAGLTDGASIVREYLEHGELTLALEHVLYMVNETSIELSETSQVYLREVSLSWLGPNGPEQA